jgi:hypothetical protein
MLRGTLQDVVRTVVGGGKWWLGFIPVNEKHAGVEKVRRDRIRL